MYLHVRSLTKSQNLKSGSMLQKNSLLIHHGGGSGSKVSPGVVTGQLEKHEKHPEQLGVVRKQ